MEEYYGAPNDFRNYVMHYGVKGMHWGVRRYQNTDGSLTDAGRKHYGYSGDRRAGGFKEVANKGMNYAKKHPEVAIPVALGTASALGAAYKGIKRFAKNRKEDHKRNLTTYDHSTNQRLELKRKMTQEEKLELAERMKKGEKRTDALRNMDLIKDKRAGEMNTNVDRPGFTIINKDADYEKIQSKVKGLQAVLKKFKQSRNEMEKRQAAELYNNQIDDIYKNIKKHIVTSNQYKRYVKAANNGQRILQEMVRTNSTDFTEYFKAYDEMADSSKKLTQAYLSSAPMGIDTYALMYEAIQEAMIERKDYIPLK